MLVNSVGLGRGKGKGKGCSWQPAIGSKQAGRQAVRCGAVRKLGWGELDGELEEG